MGAALPKACRDFSEHVEDINDLDAKIMANVWTLDTVTCVRNREKQEVRPSGSIDSQCLHGGSPEDGRPRNK